MANKAQPLEIVHDGHVYAMIVPPRAPRTVTYKGARYVLALEKDPPGSSDLGAIPSKPRVKSVPKARKYGPPSTLPGGRLDPSLVTSPKKDKVERKSLEVMRGLEEGDETNVEEFVQDIPDASIEDAPNYVWHYWPTMKAVIDKINSSAVMAELDNGTKNFSAVIAEMLNPTFNLEAVLSSPETHPDKMQTVYKAIAAMTTDLPNMVGAAELLVELLRVMTAQSIARGWVKPRDFKDLKAEHKAIISDLLKASLGSRKSVQKPASGNPPKGAKGRNPQFA